MNTNKYTTSNYKKLHHIHHNKLFANSSVIVNVQTSTNYETYCIFISHIALTASIKIRHLKNDYHNYSFLRSPHFCTVGNSFQL